MERLKTIRRAAVGVLALASLTLAASNSKNPPSPPAPFVVNFEGIQFDVVEQAPQSMKTPLQVFGVFEYKSGDTFTGSDVEMNEDLHGLIQDLRKSHYFEGRLAENLLLTPTNSTITPKQVLVMGLGDPAKFKKSDMDLVGSTGVREACRLSLTEYSHASDVQDAGVNRVPAGVIAENVLAGMIKAIRLQRYLVSQGAAEPCPLKHVTLLAGPKYFKEATAALSKVTGQMASR